MLSKIYGYEDLKVIEFVGDSRQVLDYGCGLGRYVKSLTDRGCIVTGVDISEDIVHGLVTQGFRALTPENFWLIEEQYDCVILSHVIEHLVPSDLLAMLDGLVAKLKPTGRIIIATPLLYGRFFDDYDHIKPYTHKAISVAFSDYQQQAKKPKARLHCRDVWYRYWPFELAHRPGQTILEAALKRIANLIFLGAYFASGGIVGQKTGWVGLFQKSSDLEK